MRVADVSTEPLFPDRAAAGERLAAAVAAHETAATADLVLAVPRGGLPPGRAVADRLGVPLDVVVAKKVGAPGEPEAAVGAVAADGTVWRDERALAATRADADYFRRERQAVARAASETALRYHGDDPPTVTDRTLVVVDDGVATGATLRACLRSLGDAPARVVVAVPVAPPDTLRALRRLADDVVCLETPASFRGVGAAYERFDQVSDAEAMSYLEG